MSWDAAVARITPYVVKIETQDGYGTGFLCMYNDNQSYCGIATALHVVRHADQWQQPIRITQDSGKTVLLKSDERVIIAGENGADSAVVLIDPLHLDLPKQLISLFPAATTLPIGNDVGWLGYPAIGSNTLCFFSGRISASIDGGHAYLIDGVAINGVSGGPVFHSTGADTIIVGTVTAYVANRNQGDTLPGLSVAQDVTHFHTVIGRVRSLDEARRQKSTDGLENLQESKGDSA